MRWVQEEQQPTAGLSRCLDSIACGSVERHKNGEISASERRVPQPAASSQTSTERLTAGSSTSYAGGRSTRLIVSPPKSGTRQRSSGTIITRSPRNNRNAASWSCSSTGNESHRMQHQLGQRRGHRFNFRPAAESGHVSHELAIEHNGWWSKGRTSWCCSIQSPELGRAYNNASPAWADPVLRGDQIRRCLPAQALPGGRATSGGSRCIIATAMVGDQVTGDWSFRVQGHRQRRRLKLDRKIARRRFPAVDVNPSGTRKDELLLSPTSSLCARARAMGAWIPGYRPADVAAA